MKGISVIIPNYNGASLLKSILPPLFEALNFAGLPSEVIISDDFSKDDSVEMLKKEFPLVKIIQHKKNTGFSPTINRGIFSAQYPLLLLLNSDVKVSREYIAKMIRYFNREDTFGVMGRIIGWNDDNIQDAAKFPSFHGVKIRTAGNYLSENTTEDEWLYSMYLSGANAIVSREKMLQLGGFDEIFAPFYVEDYELSLRAWRMGWKCYYEHYAICRHKVSVSIRSASKKDHINTIYYRNKMFLHAIHLPYFKYLLWYVQNLGEVIVQVMLGKLYYKKAFLKFSRQTKKWKSSRNNFDVLSGKNAKTVQEVVKEIMLSLRNRKYSTFK